jgi:AraC-like DNA-binding protein
MQVASSAVAVEIKSSCPKVAERVVAYVLENFAEDIDLDALAGEAGLSRFNFCRKFQRDCGISPMRWLWSFRTILAAEFINLDPKWSLTDVAFSCGFTSSAHFSRSFRAMFKQSPSAYRKAALAAGLGGSSGTAPRERAGIDSLYGANVRVVLKAATRAMDLVRAGD